MAKKHKVHRNPNAWKKDIQVLTCLLRLRCQPPVPYSIIANLLLKTKPSLMVKLSEKVAPSEVTVENGMADWMEKYLEEVYDNLEKWESEPWKLARGWNEDVVREMMRVAGLDVTGGGYEVMDEGELALQIKWKKNGDCKLKRRDCRVLVLNDLRASWVDANEETDKVNCWRVLHQAGHFAILEQRELRSQIEILHQHCKERRCRTFEGCSTAQTRRTEIFGWCSSSKVPFRVRDISSLDELE